MKKSCFLCQHLPWAITQRRRDALKNLSNWQNIDFSWYFGILVEFQPLSHVKPNYLFGLTKQQNKGLGIPTKAGRYLSLEGVLTQPPLRAEIFSFKTNNLGLTRITKIN